MNSYLDKKTNSVPSTPNRLLRPVLQGRLLLVVALGGFTSAATVLLASNYFNLFSKTLSSTFLWGAGLLAALYAGMRANHAFYNYLQGLRRVHQNSEARLQRLIDNVPGVIYRYILYPDGRDEFTYISPRCQEIFEVSPEVVLESSQSLWRMICPEDANRMMKSSQLAIATQTPWQAEYRICTPSGKLKWLQVCASPDVLETGEIYWDGVILEITDRKQTEALLQHHHNQLEAKVRARTADLEQANQTLARLAHLDGLTQIANRRTFDQEFEKNWKLLSREQKPLALIICDIDYFKRYNDHYGHRQGDRALQAVAQAIKKAAQRPTDLAARYGGEEFVLLLPNTDVDGAIQVAESLRQAVMNLQIEHLQSDVCEFVTLSLGVAAMIPSLDNFNRSPEQLIQNADRALYIAKDQGRNQFQADYPQYSTTADLV